MSDTTRDTHEAGDEHHAEAEPDSTNVALLGFLVAITAAVLVVTVWGLDVYFTRQTEALRYEKVLSVPSAELEQLRAEEAKVLQGYGVVDASQGLYSIPIDQGMKLFVQDAQARARANEPQRVGPAPTPAPAPGAAPAPGTAPAPGAAPAPGTAPAPAPAPPAPAGGGAH